MCKSFPTPLASNEQCICAMSLCVLCPSRSCLHTLNRLVLLFIFCVLLFKVKLMEPQRENWATERFAEWPAVISHNLEARNSCGEPSGSIPVDFLEPYCKNKMTDQHKIVFVSFILTDLIL